MGKTLCTLPLALPITSRPVRQLFPRPLDVVDPMTAYSRNSSGDGPAHGERPRVIANMVASIDGAATARGRSGPLSTPGDRRIFHGLREMVDVILVGAGTIRAEGYGPAKGNGVPIAVVSRSLELDWTSPLFGDAGTRPSIITCGSADEGLVQRASEVANVLVVGEERVDLVRALHALRRQGVERVLCEGGPTLLGQLVQLDLVDELCLTVSPMIVGDQGPRILSGMSPRRRDLELVAVLEEEGCLFLRYRIGTNLARASDLDGD